MSLPLRAECSAYPALSALFEGDVGRVEMVVRVFHQSVRHDLRQMELAATAGYWALVHQLARRVASGCRHVGEDAAADAFTAVERASSDPGCETPLAQVLEDARRAIAPALQRAAAYDRVDGANSATGA